MGKTTALAPSGSRSPSSCSVVHCAPSGSLKPIWVCASNHASPGSSTRSGSSHRFVHRASLTRRRQGARAAAGRPWAPDVPGRRSRVPRIRALLAIESNGLERTFEGGVRAVAGVDLRIAEGEIYAFLGPNGAGKTTTVRMLTTLLRPTGGSARVAGFDVVSDAAKVRRTIGVALQEAALDPLMTGRELVRLQATLHGLPREEGRRKADALLERVDLVDAADRQIGTYSGGMRRRLDMASALVHEPRVLFLDEPTTGLDPVSRRAIWHEVSKLNDEGTTVFLTTQYLEEADQLADRVGIIDFGRIVAEDTPGRLKAQIGRPHLEIRLSEDG